MEDTFTCNIDGATILDVCDNADGENVILTIVENVDSLSVALSADQARALAYALNVYAAGV